MVRFFHNLQISVKYNWAMVAAVNLVPYHIVANVLLDAFRYYVIIESPINIIK